METAPASESLESIYIRLGGVLRYISHVRFGVPEDEAEGLINDVFLGYLGRSTEVYDLQAWLIGAVSNASKKYWRKRGREVPLPVESERWADKSASDAFRAVVDRLTIDATMERLDDRGRELLRRFYLEGQSTAEIATALGTTAGTVQVQLHLTRKKVQAMHREQERPA